MVYILMLLTSSVRTYGIFDLNGLNLIIESVFLIHILVDTAYHKPTKTMVADVNPIKAYMTFHILQNTYDYMSCTRFEVLQFSGL